MIVWKIFVLIVLLATFYFTVLWHGGADWGLTQSQRNAAGIAAMIGWLLTFTLVSFT